MSITRSDNFGQPILRIFGALGNKAWPDLLLEIKKAQADRCRRIALDLSWVTSMGRAQALLLLEARENLARKGVILSVVGLSPAAIEAMAEASKLRRRFHGQRF